MKFVYNVWVVDRNDKLLWLTQTDTAEQAEQRRKAFEDNVDPDRYRMTFIGFCSYASRFWALSEPAWPIDYSD